MNWPLALILAVLWLRRRQIVG
ncbi:GlyGly-CTERM sorting domain-containing protein [Pseudomonas aeruginosa]|nr:GlyGly-CTERM sorting domain-containing protein [Pseudomonas aeruginosa]MBF8163105.1 GlyGly-CTERM sorting domain-containing protein [Pseudomonas mendocina]EKV3023600.1 GlyGly-CTERM sorting domain-containing protein [Pseudomonas aeruginosa]ELD6208936.1 GlyGly-CTERM sorting domain-containing protein [Pseudomonas aeruginosa]KAB0756889.1 GlyGly-CTERM sorting domain-containing protein [Pseudomonas aeruginosa]